jgi:hypothetical protein
MELQQLYDAYFWQIWIALSITACLGAVLICITVKSKLLDKYIEFDDEPKLDTIDEFIKTNCDECQHEPTNIKVGITHYSTEEGARARCEALYKRHKINAEITFYFANQPPVKCKALDIWDFNK